MIKQVSDKVNEFGRREIVFEATIPDMPKLPEPKRVKQVKLSSFRNKEIKTS